MAGGPDESVKHRSVEKDASFKIYDRWDALFKNFFIVALVAATTWGFVSVVRYSIHHGAHTLFGPFLTLHDDRDRPINTGLEGVKTPETTVAQPLDTQDNTSSSEPNQEETQTQTMAEGSSQAHSQTSAQEQHDYSEDALNRQILIIISVLLGAALLRGLLLRIPSWRSSEGDGMGVSLEFFHATYDDDGKKEQTRYQYPDFFQAVRRVVLTSLTVGTGGSGGIEAPVVPIGECIGAGWSRLMNVMQSDDLRIYQMAGMSAAVATLLDAPFTAALFAAEIVYNARILYRPLMYSLIGSIVAYALNNHFLAFEPLFVTRAHTAVYTLKEYMEVSAVALICSAPASLGIGFLFKRLKKMIKPFPGIVRPVIGAFFTGLIGVGIWYGFGLEPQHVLGVSEETIIQVMSSDGNPLLSIWWILFLLVIAKAFATGFTLMAGGSAGALVPSMYLGGVSGAAIYQVMIVLGFPVDANVAVFVVAGLASALVAVVQVPLAAIAFVMEVFGATYGPPAIVSCVLTYLLARRWKLYTLEEQEEEAKSEKSSMEKRGS